MRSLASARQLPRAPALLANRQALEISDASFGQGANRLIDRREEFLGSVKPTCASDRRLSENLRTHVLSRLGSQSDPPNMKRLRLLLARRYSGKMVSFMSGFLPVLSIHSCRPSGPFRIPPRCSGEVTVFLYQFFVEQDQAPIRLNGINMLAVWFVLGFWNSAGDDANRHFSRAVGRE
jgi:hypothetical protein